MKKNKALDHWQQRQPRNQLVCASNISKIMTLLQLRRFQLVTKLWFIKIQHPLPGQQKPKSKAPGALPLAAVQKQTNVGKVWILRHLFNWCTLRWSLKFDLSESSTPYQVNRNQKIRPLGHCCYRQPISKLLWVSRESKSNTFIQLRVRQLVLEIWYNRNIYNLIGKIETDK
jgi:hypothetical protein